MKLKKTILLGLMTALCALAVAACAPAAEPAGDLAATGDASATGNAAEVDISQLAQDDPYVSDEGCLQCHGGTYEAVAQLTAAYGDSNPHDSVHGGYLTCDNCHAKGNEIPEEHYCTECHDWPREEQSVLS
ncbi:cytochrome c3 family protein [Adlercreutzia equolifaciens]|uniref:cytochrome c3 family protein n=1 Tax=Adlercreutzia equolifaciens TaxID=446660 RepID=UPI00242FA4DA|nr:cytochrome c3 family protein [Adlercreutzia equolifaciens]